MIEFLRRSKIKMIVAMLRPLNVCAVVVTGIYTILWGAWVANPFWSVFGSAELYSIMHALWPEPVWGLIAICCGLLMIYGMIHPSEKTLRRGAAIGGWHWLMIAGFYFGGDWMNTGGITALTVGVYCILIYLNIKIQGFQQ
jgi:hypothetical protein